MREGLDAPTAQLSDADVAELRAFLDTQRRVQLLVWVRHTQQGLDGPLYDHHLVLGVPDDDFASGDMHALEVGLPLPGLHFDGPTWIDIFPVSEVEGLRSFGTVLWEQTTPGADPLDYRFTYEPFDPDAEAVERFAALVSAVPAVRCVGGHVSRLWKGDHEVESSVRLAVDAPFEADALTPVVEAARVSVLAGHRSHNAGIGAPDETMTILYRGAS
jgi:hypothetical protein